MLPCNGFSYFLTKYIPSHAHRANPEKSNCYIIGQRLAPNDITIVKEGCPLKGEGLYLTRVLLKTGRYEEPCVPLEGGG